MIKTKLCNYVGRSLFLGCILLATQCKKDDSKPASGLPVLVTVPFSSFDEISATGGGGSISFDGGFSVSQRGVCWSVNHNPTINDNMVEAGLGVGDFSASLSDLTPGTSYFVRAFGTNSKGTAYGNEVTVTTNSVVVPDGLVGYYKFNNNTLDYSGKGNQTTSTQITYVNDHKSAANSAAAFDGTASSLSTLVSGFSSSAMSISLWVKSSDSHNAAVGDSHNLFGITTSAPNYTIAFQSCSPTAGTACDALATVTTDNTNWNHYVISYDGTTSKTYLNGELKATKAMGLTVSSAVALNMGAPWGYFSYWTGNLDNVKIYNRAISASEVTQLFQE